MQEPWNYIQEQSKEQNEVWEKHSAIFLLNLLSQFPQGIVYHASFFCLCSNTDLMRMAVLNFNNIDYERVNVWDYGIKVLGTPAKFYLFLPLRENAILSCCSRDQSALLSPSNGRQIPTLFSFINQSCHVMMCLWLNRLLKQVLDGKF